jgi:hypothetical protein
MWISQLPRQPAEQVSGFSNEGLESTVEGLGVGLQGSGPKNQNTVALRGWGFMGVGCRVEGLVSME